MSKYLYLPVEVGTREFQAKLLTAASAAERGYTVLLGYQGHLFINAKKLPAGLFFSKGSSRAFLANVPGLHTAGHAFAASEEENFAYHLEDSPVACSPSDLPENCDLYLSTGVHEDEYLKKRFGTRLRTVVTGNARLDLLRPKMRSLWQPMVAQIRRERGRFLLINTNFATVNSYYDAPMQAHFEMWEQWGIFVTTDPEQKRREFEKLVRWEADNLAQVQCLIALLAKRPYTVVIRPHPSEAAEPWRNFVAELKAPHIHVVEGSLPIPYLLACELMVHPGCTTGMEAAILDVPAISVNAGATACSNYFVSPRVNPGATTAEEALSLIDQHWSGNDVLVRDRVLHLKTLAHYLADVDEDTLTADRIVDAFDDFGGQRHFAQDARTIDNIVWTTRSEERAFKSSHEFRMSKFGIKPDDAEAMLRDFRSSLGRFEDVTAKEVYEGVYLVTDNKSKSTQSAGA